MASQETEQLEHIDLTNANVDAIRRTAMAHDRRCMPSWMLRKASQAVSGWLY